VAVGTKLTDCIEAAPSVSGSSSALAVTVRGFSIADVADESVSDSVAIPSGSSKSCPWTDSVEASIRIQVLVVTAEILTQSGCVCQQIALFDGAYEFEITASNTGRGRHRTCGDAANGFDLRAL
jgi:hypothetical protein